MASTFTSASKTMTKVLRHDAANLGIEMSDDCYIKVQDLLDVRYMRKFALSEEDVREIVRTDVKQRYDLIDRDGCLYIRANQGHSLLNVNPNLKLAPANLKNVFHGTFLRNIGSIKKEGIFTTDRPHIHMAIDQIMVASKWPLLLVISITSARSAGIEFYISQNGVILSPGNEYGCIPAVHIVDIIDRNPSKNHNLMASKFTSASKAMTKVLRHDAANLGIEMSDDGYIKVQDLFDVRYVRKFSLGEKDVREIVRTDAKQRYNLIDRDGCLYIRANQGHSLLNINPDLKLAPSDLKNVFHGTFLRYIDSIKKQGLFRGTRLHIHMGVDERLIRAKWQAMIVIDVASARSVGIEFYVSQNGVILSPGNEHGFIPALHIIDIIHRNSRKSMLENSNHSNFYS